MSAATWVNGVQYEEFPRFPPEAARGAERRITEVGEAVLAEPCGDVTTFGTPELAQLIDDMFRTMYVAEGVGLAANQIDVALRLFVYDCVDDEGVRHVGHVCNPVLEELPLAARVLAEGDEGCLSVPGPYRPLARPDLAIVHGVDQHGEPVTLTGSGYFARCLQHETDHTNGMLYIDRLSRRTRKQVLKEMAEDRDEVLAARQEKATELATQFSA